MAKQSGLGDNFYIDGFNLSGDIGSLDSIAGGPALLEQTGIDKYAMERVGGLRTGNIDFTAFFNKSPGQEHLALSTLPRTDRVATYCRGTLLGSPAASCWAVQIGYDPTRGDDGALTIASSVQASAYGLEWGEQLTAGVRTDTTATNGAALDGGAATAFGMQAYLQVFAVTGTSVTVTIQDSADNVTFAAIAGGAFAAATGRGAQRIQISNAATVRRYVRVATSGTFTNAQFAVNFVRNLTLGQVF